MYANWVRENIATNKPYDQVARERLAAEGYDGPTRHFLPYDVIGPPGETMAEEVRVFMGRRLDCAQCHNHPYETWSQDQFWGLAAFFGRTFKMGDTGNEYVIFEHPLNEEMGSAEVNGSIKMYHPRTKAELTPTLLDGTKIKATGRQNPRKALAEWMVHHPYFAEAAVNRMWSYFFGRGLVDPVDDFRSTNPPTHPELLARLAEDFRTQQPRPAPLDTLNRDLPDLSVVGTPGRKQPGRSHQLLARAAPRARCRSAARRNLRRDRRSGSIHHTESLERRSPARHPAGTRADPTRRAGYLLFALPGIVRPSEPVDAARAERSRQSGWRRCTCSPARRTTRNSARRRGVCSSCSKPAKSNTEIIQEFYLAAFARQPEPKESSAIEESDRRRVEDREAALKEFVWALLCSREFAENHEWETYHEL